MAVGKEIRTKISSIKSTQKITSAMELVAASKMRKVRDRMERSRPYAHKIRNVIAHLSEANPEYRHIYMDKREVKRVGYIIVTTDRGLCGGLNINLLRKSLSEMKAWSNKGVEVDLCLVGTKAESFFKRFGGNVVANSGHIGDKPSITDLIGVVRVMLDAYEAKEIDELHLVFNDFVNTMSQEPTIQKLLPVEKIESEDKKYWDYIYEPDAKEILEALLARYVESQVYQAVIENLACEQAARMVAMKSATENAGDFIDSLEMIYNKARQAAITQEIAEIVGGAAAV